ncbi:two-component system sensor histidine kinase NtrB [Amorphus orientalis]|uniref:Sensor protein FixL n=1 Tax=Amorphus orientalis TaxID=649198 RepID=A0AAE3VNI6_9HYPH|nr:PAS domain S-box protein [Amorphus orientalis]MDQ0315301.1 two-component system sensor kinase FixL [Amorphus orientalis]
MRDEPGRNPSDSQAVSEARLLSVLDTAVDGIIVIDETGCVLIYNKACERMFGYRAEEIIGENVKAIMPPRYAHEHDDYIANYRRTGSAKIIGIGRRVEARHRDGTVFPVELSVGEAHTPQGRQFIGILRDDRPRESYEKRLAELQAELVHLARVNAMDEMGSAIAHELNQPLTAAMLYLQAATRRLRSDGEAEDPFALEVIGKAMREAERAASIIQRMRGFIEKRAPNRRSCHMATLVDEALELALVGGKGRNIEIVRDLDPELPAIPVDPIQIEQILVNLVRNAIEVVEGREHRRIEISGVVHEDGIRVSVADSGPGIHPDRLPDLFKAFSSNKSTGLGLGLAISRSIAQNHGGELSVDPGGGGRGACFRLDLPLHVDPSDDEAVD